MTGLNVPDVRKLEATVPAATIAATQDQNIGECPFAGAVSAVNIYPEANLVGHATDYRTFAVVNKGLDGNGTTVVASFATDTPTTDDLADFDERALVLSVVANALNVVAGDVLAVVETVAGAGIAHSGYKIVVEVGRVTT